MATTLHIGGKYIATMAPVFSGIGELLALVLPAYCLHSLVKWPALHRAFRQYAGNVQAVSNRCVRLSCRLSRIRIPAKRPCKLTAVCDQECVDDSTYSPCSVDIVPLTRVGTGTAGKKSTRLVRVRGHPLLAGFFPAFQKAVEMGFFQCITRGYLIAPTAIGGYPCARWQVV